MKSIAFFLLFLGLVSVSMARQSAFLDDLFTPTINTLDTALVNCTASDSCAGKGDSCAGNYMGHDGSVTCSPTNGTCCASGLFCINKTCMVNTEGGKCGSPSDCYPSGQFGCVNSTCQYMMQVGEACTDNSLCFSGNCNKNTSVCQGNTNGSACTSSLQCNFGLYCAYNVATMNSTCQNTIAQGSSCNGIIPCSPGNVCFEKTFGNGSTCQQVGTQQAGYPCVPTACGNGLVCNTAVANMTCVTANTSSVACTASANCSNGAICACSYVTGSSYCFGTTYNDPCTEETTNFIQCLAENNCQFASEAPDSCAQTNCESDYKKSQSCSCSLDNSQSGKCSYSQYCGGFPVWAIIVIIVVAIVLVLAIVLLVFFMMRRRRQYDSI